jgi:small multidrug resistance family-3 protein
VVNAPAWDFGRLLGLYVVFFFWIAQGISTVAFRQPPSPAVLLGGGFISIGGLIIAMANRQPLRFSKAGLLACRRRA